jgi:gamma-glutamyltranspeptidase/glutathione hydrolase
MKIKFHSLFSLAFVLLISLNYISELLFAKDTYQSKRFDRGVVVSQSKLASEIGAEILRKGGNAIDAAVATGYAIGVVQPNGSGIGGGGFALIYIAKTNEIKAIDFRERAPKAINNFPYEFQNGPKAGGIPGEVLGFEFLRIKYGKLNRKVLIEPSIQLAENGFPINEALANRIKDKQSVLNQFESSKKIFIPSSNYLETGNNLKQIDLAQTLRIIQEGGADEFYKGKLADQIAEGIKANDGIINKSDLANYRIYELKPICGTYRKEYKVCSFPPPSSGGICILEALNILENTNLPALKYNSPERLNYLANSLKASFEDRANKLGDPRFNSLPISQLTSKSYAKKIFDSKVAIKDIKVGTLENNKNLNEKPETTHWTVVDKHGNIATITASLNGALGSGFVIPQTGILLNNTLDDFSLPQAANQYGLIGNKLNEPAPGKTPLSSMSPTIVLEKDNQPILALGSPGGPTIISAVLNVLLGYLDQKFSLEQAVSEGRLHHQWKPDYISAEDTLINTELKQVLQTDYKQKFPEKNKSVWNQFYWAVEAVELNLLKKELIGASDPRQENGLVYE